MDRAGDGVSINTQGKAIGRVGRPQGPKRCGRNGRRTNEIWFTPILPNTQMFHFLGCPSSNAVTGDVCGQVW